MRTFLLFLIAVNALPVFADDLTIKNGTVYSDYSIYKVSEKGLSISHKNGISTIPFEDLPDEIQKKYAEQYYAAKKKDELAKKKANEERSLLDISCENNPRELIYMKVADFRNGVIALEYFPERRVVTMKREIRIIPAKYGKNVFISSLTATKKGKEEMSSCHIQLSIMFIFIEKKFFCPKTYYLNSNPDWGLLSSFRCCRFYVNILSLLSGKNYRN